MPLETPLEDKTEIKPVEIPKQIQTPEPPPAVIDNLISSTSSVEKPIETVKSEEPTPPQPPPQEISSNLIKACESYTYKRFYKMLKFGVPRTAVKIKMASEGLEDDSILDTPDLLIEKCPEDDEEPEE